MAVSKHFQQFMSRVKTLYGLAGIVALRTKINILPALLPCQSILSTGALASAHASKVK
jgi:hypothetical protein